MTTQLPKNFRTGGGVQALYNFVDIAQKVGILIFYGATDQDGNGILTTSVTNSDVIANVYWGANIISTYTQFFDIDFDVTINASMTFKGIASINVPLKTYSTSIAGAESVDAYADVLICKGAATLVSGTTAVISCIPTSIFDHERMMLLRVIVPLTVFKKGDVLRLTVQVYAKKTGTPTDPSVAFGHDPKDRIPTIANDDKGDPLPALDSTFKSPESTQLILNMPVKIEL